jgi:hypothetical protein
MSLRPILGVLVGLLVVAGVEARAQLVISEVLFDPAGVDTGSQVVELRNLGAQPADVSGHWLFFPPSAWQFPPGAIVPAGGTVLLRINRTGSSTSDEFFTGIGGMRSLNRQDSLGLFSTNLFADPTKILDFVEWGRGGLGGEDVAVAAGLWSEGEPLDVESMRAGSTLSRAQAAPGVASWCVDGSPTIGEPNDECTLPVARSPVLLQEIGNLPAFSDEPHPVVELKNVGGNLEDLGGKFVVLGGEHAYQFPLETFVRPGETVILHLGVDSGEAGGSGGVLELFTGSGTFRPLHDADSVSFHSNGSIDDPTRLIDYVQWGAAGAPLEETAVLAGRWGTGEFVDAAGRREHGTIAARHSPDPDPPRGAGRWLVDNTPTLGDDNDAFPSNTIVVNEILIDPEGENAGASAVELASLIPDYEFDVGGYAVCIESPDIKGELRCYVIPEGTRLASGEHLVLRLNQTGADSTAELYTGPFVEIDSRTGVVALYASAGITEPNNMIDYARWGTDCSTGEEVAATVGMWLTGDTIDVEAARDGSSVSYRGRGNTSTSYRIDRTPSIGRDNDEEARQEPFRRGDCNDDGGVDISDAISMFGILFLGAYPPVCENACDTNDDELRDISDPVFLLNSLFRSREPLPAPGLECATEPEPGSLTCGSYLGCS